MSQSLERGRNHLICSMLGYCRENFESFTALGLKIQIILFFGNKCFVHIVEIFDLIKITGLMLEQTPLTVRAEQPFVECCASLRFILIVVDRRRFTHQFMLAMSELAFWTIPTQPHFNPILAHLSLILRLVYFLDLAKWQKGLRIEMKQAVRRGISHFNRQWNFCRWFHLWHWLDIIRLFDILLRRHLFCVRRRGIMDTAILSLIVAQMNGTISAGLLLFRWNTILIIRWWLNRSGVIRIGEVERCLIITVVLLRLSFVMTLVVYYIRDVGERRSPSPFERRISALTITDVVVLWADISSGRSSTRLLIYFLGELWTLNSSQSLLVSPIAVACCQCFLCDLTLHDIIRKICQFCPRFTSFSCSGCVYFENFSRFILIFKNSNLISLLIINSLYKQSIYNSLASFWRHTSCNTRFPLMRRGAWWSFFGIWGIAIVEYLLLLVTGTWRTCVFYLF